MKISIWIIILTKGLLFGQNFETFEKEGSSTELRNLPIAPLMSLDVQFPLELSQKNREAILENPASLDKSKRKISQELENHAFPWLKFAFLIMGAVVSWIAYLTLHQWIKFFHVKRDIDERKEMLSQFIKEIIKPNQVAIEQDSEYVYTKLTSVLNLAIGIFLKKETKSLTKEELFQLLKEKNLEFKSMTKNQREIVLNKEANPKIKEYPDQALLLFNEIDLVRFGGKRTTSEEVQGLIQRVVKYVTELTNSRNRVVSD